MVSIPRDLAPRALDKARRTAGHHIPEHWARFLKIGGHVVRSGPMTASGYRFGSTFRPLRDDVAAVAPVEPTPGALRTYFEGREEGRGIWKWRHYFEVYERHLSRFAGADAHVLEIGVYSGGSLEMWREYFGPRATLYGADLEEACRAYESDGVRMFIGDQKDREFWARFKNDVPYLDVVIDDGGHAPDEQRITLEELLPILRPGGVYICEDIGTDNTFLAYIAGLAHNLITYSGVPTENGVASGVGSFQRAVASIHLYPFLAVIERTVTPPELFECPKHGTIWQPFYDH